MMAVEVIKPARTTLRLFFLFFSFLLLSYGNTFALRVIKLGTLAAEGTAWIKFWNKVARSIEEKSGNRIRIITYTGGVMGDEEEMIRKIRMGQLHAGGFTINGLMRIAPEISVLDVPFLFRNYKEVDYIVEKFLPEFEVYFRKHGFELITFLEQGFVYFFSVKDIKSFRDISKTKMWVWFGELTAEKVARLLGAGIVFLSVQDVFSSIERGIVESFQTSPMACLSLQWCKLVRVMLNYPYRYEPAAVVISKRAFEKLPQDIRRVIKEEGKKHMWDFINEIRKGQEDFKEKLKILGIKFVDPPEEDIAWFRSEVMKKIWFSEDAPYPHELLRKIHGELEILRRNKMRDKESDVGNKADEGNENGKKTE